MKFGYFTLSDNNYRNNDRSPNQCVADILEQALYAEELGMHSVWIGEHHFSTLGVNRRPRCCSPTSPPRPSACGSRRR